MKKKHLFIKYLLINLSLLAVLLAGCFADIFYTYNLEKKNIMEQNETALSRSIGELEELLNSIYAVSSALRSNNYMKSLAGFKGDTLPADKYVLMNYLQKDLTDTQMTAGISAASFVLFRDNPVFVSNAQTSSNFETYYGRYLQVEEKTAQEFKEEILGCNEQITCLKYDKVTVFQQSKMKMLEHSLAVVVRIRNTNTALDRSVAFCFILDQEELYEKLFRGISEENSMVVCRPDGTLLCGFGSHAEELAGWAASQELAGTDIMNRTGKKDQAVSIGGVSCYVRSAFETVNGNRIFITVPEDLVKLQTVQLLRVNLVVLFAAIGISLAATVFLSYRKFMSMQGILNNINERNTEEFHRGNEYQFIRENMDRMADSRDTYRRDLEAVRNRMKENMLEEMFLWEITSEKTLEQCEKLLPEGTEFFFLAAVKCEEEDPEVLADSFCLLDDLFVNYWKGGSLGVQTAVNEKSFLFQIRPDAGIRKQVESEKIQALLQTATEALGEIFHVGISGIGMKASGVHTCYVQAEQALMGYFREHTNTVGWYSDLLDSTGENLTNMDFFTKLYQYLLSGKQDAFNENLEKLVRHYRLNPYLYERNISEIYYSVRHALVSAARELSIGEQELQIPSWRGSQGLEAGIQNLQKAAERLFAANEDKKKSHNDALEADIVDYIQEHYSDPALTAGMVCQEMKISEKYLSQFLKEHTGKTFAKYVEDLRVEQAKKLLKETSFSNEKIAEAAGFGSANSFYRVFKKKTGVSPGEFRGNPENCNTN